jgi:hypothetical protein
MRVVGAGSTGGYFGGRLAQADGAPRYGGLPPADPAPTLSAGPITQNVGGKSQFDAGSGSII